MFLHVLTVVIIRQGFLHDGITSNSIAYHNRFTEDLKKLLRMGVNTP